jgi:hypothetical protein
MIRADSERDEWLIDESLQETFPASDPISPARPGSLIGLRYAAKSRNAGLGVLAGGTLLPWLIGALLGGTIAGIILARQRHTS